MTPPTPSETSSVRRCKHKKITGEGRMLLSAPLPSFRRLGQCLGQAKNAKMPSHYLMPNTKKVPDFCRNQELFGGDCWTRTSDLLRVKRLVCPQTLYSSGFAGFFRTTEPLHMQLIFMFCRISVVQNRLLFFPVIGYFGANHYLPALDRISRSSADPLVGNRMREEPVSSRL